MSKQTKKRQRNGPRLSRKLASKSKNIARPAAMRAWKCRRCLLENGILCRHERARLTKIITNNTFVSPPPRPKTPTYLAVLKSAQAHDLLIEKRQARKKRKKRRKRAPTEIMKRVTSISTYQTVVAAMWKRIMLKMLRGLPCFSVSDSMKEQNNPMWNSGTAEMSCGACKSPCGY